MKIKFLASVVSASLLLSSCLKDKNVTDRVYGMEGTEDVDLVEFPQSPQDVKSLDFSTNDTTFNLVAVRLNSEKPAQEDIQVTLVPNNTLVTSAGYTIAPTGIYRFENLTVTIPRGQQQGYLRITTKASNIAQGSYAFGFSIGSVSNSKYIISSNYKDILVVVGVKNRYDGVYRLKGFHNRPTLTNPYDEEVHLITTGANSVKMFWPALGADAHPIHGGVTYYGNFTTEFIFAASPNGAGNYPLTAVDNPYTPGSPVFTVGPATDSRFVTATRTVYAQYYYNNNLQRMFTDTLTYLRPR
jgi:hypothetical protein